MNAWDFVDALLEESERKNESCSFSPAQVTKLRQMIAEIPDAPAEGRKRSRLNKNGNRFVTHTIRIPENTYESLNNMAIMANMSFNSLANKALQDYVERIKK